MEAVAVARRRKVNFSKREVRVLLEEVERLRGPLLGIGRDCNIARRGQQSIEQAWDHVAQCVSAVAPVRRQHRDVRKKWADLKWAALRAGGHGEATDVVSRTILRIIRGEETGLQQKGR
ncbi:nuclear apoptosis-inducing factor 1-like [Frankliniella occidentalis]|uniref:Regulatory protein zeste n=1 Tax=Frankliniella occidentalis TaxID=133901 RepID=A0A9C6XV98_FRAOC|nr:nuclear apoptosis-inducing factor 1-like [Frankliniella occidentalis]